jgi:hypothetical protein
VIRLSADGAIRHLVNHGKTIAYESKEPEVLFYAKYYIGKRWSLGAVDGVITKVEYFPNAEPPTGQVVFEIKADINMEVVNEQ